MEEYFYPPLVHEPFWFFMVIYLSSQTRTPISHFWMTYALYNIGSKIKSFNPTLYSNSQPHSPKPNFYWSRILKVISKININISPDAFESLAFKSFCLLILIPDSNPIPSLPDLLNIKPTPSSHTWSSLFLFKPHTSFFFNAEKEIAFRTAYKGYAWGCFFQKHLIPPRFSTDFLCKLCSFSTDDPTTSFLNTLPQNILFPVLNCSLVKP